MASSVSLLIQQGQRRARQLRPATLIYGGAEFPCAAGNEDFFERLAEGGFRGVRALHVVILRCDISPGLVFARGQNVQVRDEESKDLYRMTVGETNSYSPAAIMLNLEATPS